jgi:hypothetical protein
LSLSLTLSLSLSLPVAITLIRFAFSSSARQFPVSMRLVFRLIRVQPHSTLFLLILRSSSLLVCIHRQSSPHHFPTSYWIVTHTLFRSDAGFTYLPVTLSHSLRRPLRLRSFALRSLLPNFDTFPKGFKLSAYYHQIIPFPSVVRLTLALFNCHLTFHLSARSAIHPL